MLQFEWHPGHYLVGCQWSREPWPGWPGTANLRFFLGPLALRLAWPLPNPYGADPPEEEPCWLCECGEYVDGLLCCPHCTAEPPWGCDCDLHDSDGEEEEEDESEYGVDYP